ncbi:hypothetical protein [Spirosoma utsteinense]|uniref:Uncharacterized protein n=1 Tax=Spirosoma utsteinense TaxID=2585773 RepID=A0ABR6W1N6_9BACT|nr:hypothetical protein [Spirosoma utsteinense]MBC3784949.1 hypothetical protein [Spirosoma utsteinense]MBC3790443.1 hypothetical protein [Spirosoma utsteinense]
MKNKPSPAELQLIKDQQKRIQPLLESNASWSEGDFSDLLFSLSEWTPARSGFYVPLEKLEELSRDSRTPEASQPYLAMLITQAKTQKTEEKI